MGRRGAFQDASRVDTGFKRGRRIGACRQSGSILKGEHMSTAEAEQVTGWWASDEGDGSQTVFVYRKEGGAQSILDRYTIDPETMPTLEDFQFAIKEQHGGGVYEAVIRTPGGQMVKRIPFSIGGLPKRQVEPVPAMAPAPADSNMDKLLTVILDSQRRSEERMLQVLEKLADRQAEPVAAPADPFLMFERAANFLSAKGATPPPPKTLLEQMLEVKQVGELMGLGSGGGGTDTGWGSLATMITPLAEMMKESTVNDRLKLQLALSRQKQQAPAQPAALPAKTATPAPAASPFSALLTGFAPVLPQLVEAAQAGHAAAEVAGHLMQIVPTDDRAALRAFLDREEALADMTAMAPGIENHFEWFAELANALIEQIDGGADAAGTRHTTATAANTATDAAQPKVQDTGRDTRNQDNPATHGGAGPKGPGKPRRSRPGAGAGVRTETEGLPQ